jgi:hypothetical protein
VTCSSLRASNAAAMNARHGGRRSACSFTPPLCCGYVRSGLPSILSGFCGLRNRYRLVRGGDGCGRTRVCQLRSLPTRTTRGTSLCGPARAREARVARSTPSQPCLGTGRDQSLTHFALRDRNQSLLALRRVGTNGGEESAPRRTHFSAVVLLDNIESCLLARCRCSRCRGRTCSSTASVGKRRRFECAFATVANVGGCPGCVAGRRGSASCCSGCSPR